MSGFPRITAHELLLNVKKLVQGAKVGGEQADKGVHTEEEAEPSFNLHETFNKLNTQLAATRCSRTSS
ncbi:hypothetical protein TorRG33x02_203390 [Trema orientale]|uniref:Uncharacterized protein n=1 Tax=Trema orientale TaxID=63057 RepID=A0A2P5EEC8_TREOI|nr:hypothetical protein TorRG33x02_203390 [Trema orientale]